MEVVDFLKSGQRLKQPNGCPDKMYFFSNSFRFMPKDLSHFLTRKSHLAHVFCFNSFEIMISCWHPEPSTRPSFTEIVTSLEEEFKVP